MGVDHMNMQKVNGNEVMFTLIGNDVVVWAVAKLAGAYKYISMFV